MVLSTKDIGLLIKPVDMDVQFMQMVMYTMVSGATINHMDKAPTSIKMVQNMKDNGKMIYSMEKVINAYFN